MRTGNYWLDRYLRSAKRRLKQLRLVQAVAPPRIPKKRTAFADLDLFLAAIKQKLETPDIHGQLLGLSEIYFQIDTSEFDRLDPFGDTYREKVLQLYRQVTGHSHYDAMLMERTDAADNLKDDFTPIPYRFQTVSWWVSTEFVWLAAAQSGRARWRRCSGVRPGRRPAFHPNGPNGLQCVCH